MHAPPRKLLFIVEKGGYPVNAPEYAALGFEVSTVLSMRKALSLLKKSRPDVICVEFNVDPAFRDRVSNLEPLLARLQTDHPGARVIVFADREHDDRLRRIRSRFPIADVLYFPLGMAQITQSLARTTADAAGA